MRKTFLLAAIIAGLLGSGCRSYQLANDQDHIRSAVMQLHEHQLMDNLVRARKGLPILHLDYSNMTGTITQTGSGTAGGMQTLATNAFFNIPASVVAMARTFTGVNTLSASGMQVNQLTITAQPVTSSPEVYSAYLAFLKEPDHLRESPCPPGCDEALLSRCYEENCDTGGCGGPFCFFGHFGKGNHLVKTYYWVPRVYADEFRKLALYTVAVRGQPVALSPNFEATVLGVKEVKQLDPKDDRNYELFIKIDSKIPNDSGYMVATIAGKLYEDKDAIKVLINRTGGLIAAQPGTVLGPNQQTDVVRLSVNLDTFGKTSKIDDLVKGLANQKVGFRLNNFVPSGNPTDRVLQDIRMQTELLRLGQFQSKSNP